MSIKIKFFTLLLSAILISSCLVGCKGENKKEVIPDASFSNQTQMFKQEGFSIIMDTRFEYQLSDDCAMSCVNGNLTFEAFYLEKYFFSEKDKNIDTTKEALQYVNPNREVKENSLLLPYVEYTKDNDKGVNYTFYYVCIEDSERYWMCTFFAPTSSFEGYRERISNYLSTIEAVYEAE